MCTVDIDLLYFSAGTRFFTCRSRLLSISLIVHFVVLRTCCRSSHRRHPHANSVIAIVGVHTSRREVGLVRWCGIESDSFVGLSGIS